MKLEHQLKICTDEINIGLKAKAVNRLNLLIKEYPDEISVRETLGKLYFDAGFFDAAGLQWLLSEATPEREKCVSIYFKSINGSARQALREYKYRGNEEALPDYALKKLRELQTQADNPDKKGYKKRESTLSVTAKSNITPAVVKVGCLLVVIIFCVVLFLGAKELFVLIKNQF